MDGNQGVVELLRAFQESISTKQEGSTKNHSIPVGISNRHVHLSQQDLVKLFGEDYKLQKKKDLSQPGQYACCETIILCGPKGAIENVRILGPTRKKTQVEILATDGFTLGINPKVRLSGDLQGTDGITLVGKKGSVSIEEGVIIAQRHIHMSLEDSKRLQVEDGQVVSVEVAGRRGGTYDHVAVRATENSALECHFDLEEANAMGLHSLSNVQIK